MVNLDHLIQVAALFKVNQWFRCWILNPFLTQIFIANHGYIFACFKEVYIALGYTVDDTRILSPLKSPTT